MATVTYALAMPPHGGLRAPNTKRMARLYSQGVGTVILPWWPSDVAWDGLAPAWEQQPRPGRKPLLLRSGESLPTLRIGCVVAAPTPDTSVWPVLNGLGKIAASPYVCALSLGSRLSYWRVSQFSYTELDWTSAKDGQFGACSKAEVSLELTQPSDASIPMGPVKPKG